MTGVFEGAAVIACCSDSRPIIRTHGVGAGVGLGVSRRAGGRVGGGGLATAFRIVSMRRFDTELVLFLVKTVGRVECNDSGVEAVNAGDDRGWEASIPCKMEKSEICSVGCGRIVFFSVSRAVCWKNVEIMVARVERDEWDGKCTK